MNSSPRPLIKSFLLPFYRHVTSFTRPSAGLTIFKSFFLRPGDEAITSHSLRKSSNVYPHFMIIA